MNWNIREHEVVEKLNRILEDGAGRIHSTAEDFESKIRQDVSDLAIKTKDALRRGRIRTTEAGEALATSAREHPAASILAIAGIALVVGGLIIASQRCCKRS